MSGAPRDINVNALESDIRAAIINRKVNACPITVRQAWHASGTFDKDDKNEKTCGGSDGSTMRFDPEFSHGANAGLVMTIDMLRELKDKYPEVSVADLWCMAGAAAIKFSGGPEVPYHFGRTDAPDASYCPPDGRLPDASQGAQHLRDVFYRMGFGDKEIVLLSGAHTLGRCHIGRSGFDGAWTSNPLKFDNEYFKNLINKKWKVKEWDGPKQYVDENETLMMLPTDVALIEDPKFKVFVEQYANDEAKFFEDFSVAFDSLLSLGTKCPVHPAREGKDLFSDQFRTAAMHGSLEEVTRLAPKSDVNALEESSGRSALHKAAFWGHNLVVKFLIEDLKLDVNLIDYNGDSPLHDATRFGHTEVVKQLLANGSKLDIKNKEGRTPADIAQVYQKLHIIALFDAQPKL